MQARWQLMMCVGAAMLMTSAGDDVKSDVMLTFDTEEDTAPLMADPVWPGIVLSDPELVALTMVAPRGGAPVAPPLGGGRRRRSPPQDGADEEASRGRGGRRRKGRRRGGRRRGGKRRRKGRRTTTTTTAAPTAANTPLWVATTPAPASTAPPTTRRSGRRRTTSAPYTERMTTTAPPTTAPPLPDYNVAPAGSVNHRPVIGVLAQTVPRKLKSLTLEEDSSYINSFIAASYVKLLEAAGARVVPIMVDQSEHYYREMYRYLNGLLLPDGEAEVEDSGYARAFNAMWSVAAKHKQDHFPVLGVGLGMELVLKAHGPTELRSCDADNLAAAVDVTPGSRLFARPGGSALSSELAGAEAAVYFRRRCLTSGGLRAGPLADSFRTIGTSRDHSGRQIVAGVEHQSLPVWGVQFRPEMPLFEWSRDEAISNVPRSDAAARLAHHLATAFVAEARLSRHRFPSTALEDDYLIYNYEPEYTGVRGSRYTACYFFA